MIITELGEQTYEAYRSQILGVDGVKCENFPRWIDLSLEVQTAWRMAAGAAVTAWIRRVSFDSIVRAMIKPRSSEAGDQIENSGGVECRE